MEEKSLYNNEIYGDYLCRCQTVFDITNIVRACIKAKKSTTFSIEGEWGKGKTWTLEQIANLLEGNDITIDDTNKKKKIASDFLVFRYNAWEKDYYDEPLLAIIITIINQLNEILLLDNIIKGESIAILKLSKKILEEALSSISIRLMGVDIVGLSKQGIRFYRNVKKEAKIKTESDFFENNIEKDINKVVSVLNKLSKEIPIVFVVDELDRCLPEHAIKTLERLHHVFGKINVSVTIISVNESQLKTTIKKMFGGDVSFEGYLRKFVDFRIVLDSGSVNKTELQKKLSGFFDLFGDSGDMQLCTDIIADLCRNMTAREFEKVCNNAILCHSFVGKDATHFSKYYGVAELMLFAFKIAKEKENNRGNILPIYANVAETDLAKFLKGFFQEIPRRSVMRLSNAKELICHIYMKGVLTKEEYEVEYPTKILMEMADIVDFYDEYIRYYKLIK